MARTIRKAIAPSVRACLARLTSLFVKDGKASPGHFDVRTHNPFCPAEDTGFSPHPEQTARYKDQIAAISTVRTL